MVIITQRDKPKRLRATVGELPHGTEHLGHAVHRPRACVECDLDEIALIQPVAQYQQASGFRDGLEFGSSALAAFEADASQHGTGKLDPGRAPRWVRLGELGHKQWLIWHVQGRGHRLRKNLSRFPEK